MCIAVVCTAAEGSLPSKAGPLDDEGQASATTAAASLAPAARTFMRASCLHSRVSFLT